MQVYSSRFPSRKPKTERWGQWISSQQCCNNRLLLLPLIRVLPGQNEIVQNLDESGYYKYTAREGLENVCSYVTLIGSWQLQHPELNQEELPPSIQRTGVRQTNNGWMQAYFSSPPPPSPLFWRIDLSLGVIFLLAPTLGQDKESNVLCSDDTVNFTIFLTRMTEMTGTTEVIRDTGMTRVTRVTWVTKITGTTGTTGLAWINRMTGISWMCSISGMTWSLMKEPEKNLIL